MKRLLGFPVRLASAVRRRFAAFAGDRRANIAALTALMIIPITGAAGLAIEVSGWYMTQRLLQNAADSAVLSAGQNGGTFCAANNTSSDCGVYPSGTPIITHCTTVGTFDCEAVAAAQKFGLVDQSSNVFVEAHYYTSASGTCPVSNTACYSVTIRKKMPLTFMKVIGYSGDATIGSTHAVLVKASAMASAGQAVGYCLMSLDTTKSSKSGITLSGCGGNGNNSYCDLGGCDIFSNTTTTCNGDNNKGDFGINFGVTPSAGKGNSQCGAQQATGSTINETSLAWHSLYNDLPDPATACSGGYHYTTDANFSSQTGNNLSGGVVASNGSFSYPTIVVCGDLKLGNGGLTVSSASPGALLVIENGSLYLNGQTLQTASGNGLTIAFSGTSTDTHPHSMQPDNGSVGGVMNYSAPSSGTWSGVALYQDPRLTASGSNDLNYSGSAYQIDVTGLFYIPNSTVTISGAINHATAGYACFGMIALDIKVSGGGSIFPNPTSQCNLAGLVLPASPESKRAALIQ